MTLLFCHLKVKNGYKTVSKRKIEVRARGFVWVMNEVELCRLNDIILFITFNFCFRFLI